MKKKQVSLALETIFDVTDAIAKISTLSQAANLMGANGLADELRELIPGLYRACNCLRARGRRG